MDKSKKILDLRLDGKLSIEYSKILDILIDDCIKDFNQFNRELITNNKLSETDLFLSISSRDSTSSSLFDYLARLNLLIYLSSKNLLPNIILVSNIEYKKIIKKFLESIEHREVKVICNSSFSYFFRILKNILVSTYLFFISLTLSKFLRIKKIPLKEIIFVDTFIIKESFENGGEFVDRYYSGFKNHLSFRERKDLWFSPTLVDLKNPLDFYKVFKKQKESDYNFLFEESFISIRDFFYAMYQSLSSYKKIKLIPIYNEIDISNFVKKESSKDIFSPSYQKAIFKYIFIKKLKNYDVEIKGVINWFENQIKDRAIVLGFKKFYPDVLIKGYQSYFFPKYDLHKNPIDIEVNKGTIPNIISIISENQIHEKQKFFSNLNLEIVPSLRFEYINKIKYDQPDKELIFIPLSIDIDQCKQLINFAKQTTNIFSKNSKVVFKFHPKFTKKEFFKLLPDANDKSLFFSEDPSYIILQKSTFLISSASSLCVEAASLGIPVAILANNNGFTKSPLPEPSLEDLWCTFYSRVDFEVFYNKTKKNPFVKKYNFFTKFSSEDVKKLFFEFK